MSASAPQSATKKLASTWRVVDIVVTSVVARYQAWFDNARGLRELIADVEARSLTAFNAAVDPPGKSSR